MGGRGASSTGAGGNASAVSYARDGSFDQRLFSKLPKKLQVKNITDIGVENHGGERRYHAVIQFDDGFSRSIGEYTLSDFKNYINDVLFVDRNTEY